MLFDPMPVVHLFPHDILGNTSHQLDESCECWCEPKIEIVKPGHPLAKEDNQTRVVTHDRNNVYPPLPPTVVHRRIENLLKNVQPPPEGGWDKKEITDMVESLLGGGKQEPSVPKPNEPSSPAPPSDPPAVDDEKE